MIYILRAPLRTRRANLGVLATEAFDLAGNPLAFPEQVEAPRSRFNINNYGEGLRPWQPKKIYHFSDANNLDFEKGKGPEYPTIVLPASAVPIESTYTTSAARLQV